MSRQNLRYFQDIQEFKIFLRSWQGIQDVERWEDRKLTVRGEKWDYSII